MSLRPETEDLPTAPELFVPDVEAAVEYFTGTLGFQVYRLEPGDFAVLWLEGSIILVADEHYYFEMGAAATEPRGRAIDTRIMVRDVDATYERVKRNGAAIVHDIGDRFYGLRDFVVQDPWGFRWRFAAPLPAS
jgi:uncharacterized glyoxalase superfamily protein PhnB